jgi:hypothetical protein
VRVAGGEDHAVDAFTAVVGPLHTVRGEGFEHAFLGRFASLNRLFVLAEIPDLFRHRKVEQMPERESVDQLQEHVKVQSEDAARCELDRFAHRQRDLGSLCEFDGNLNRRVARSDDNDALPSELFRGFVGAGVQNASWLGNVGRYGV